MTVLCLSQNGAILLLKVGGVLSALSNLSALNRRITESAAHVCAAQGFFPYTLGFWISRHGGICWGV